MYILYIFMTFICLYLDENIENVYINNIIIYNYLSIFINYTNYSQIIESVWVTDHS